jgi:molecular chaperone HscA
MLEDLRAAIDKDGESLLDATELKCLEVALDELQVLRDSCDDHRQLANQIESIGKSSEDFAARRMDASIKQALAGLSLDEALDK